MMITIMMMILLLMMMLFMVMKAMTMTGMMLLVTTQDDDDDNDDNNDDNYHPQDHVNENRCFSFFADGLYWVRFDAHMIPPPAPMLIPPLRLPHRQLFSPRDTPFQPFHVNPPFRLPHLGTPHSMTPHAGPSMLVSPCDFRFRQWSSCPRTLHSMLTMDEHCTK